MVSSQVCMWNTRLRLVFLISAARDLAQHGPSNTLTLTPITHALYTYNIYTMFCILAGDVHFPALVMNNTFLYTHDAASTGVHVEH
jgi:hypothetical protein